MKALKNRKELVRKDNKKEQETVLIQQALLNDRLNPVLQDEHEVDEEYPYESQPTSDQDQDQNEDSENFTEGQETYFSDNSQDIFESQEVFGATI